MRLIRLVHFTHDQGNCWISKVPDGLAPGETVSSSIRSSLRLFEDGNELGPPSAAHELIRSKGLGAFSHWEGMLYFSPSDNSDPTRNGRDYEIVAPTEEEGHSAGTATPWLGRYAKMPVNYGPIDSKPEQIRDAAAYAIKVARSYVDGLPDGRSYLKGKSLLELGPGTDFATALALACWGSGRVAVTDRFLASYQHSYHTPLYEQVAQMLATDDPGVDLRPLERCIKAQAHMSSEILCLYASLESFELNTEYRFDIVLSNAVLEHLFHPVRGLKGLWNVTTTGGLGLHQVDFRDHRNFDRPLEYLLMDEFSFVEIMQETNCECGNRLRPHQLQAMFKLAGFEHVKFNPNMWADELYLDEFLNRLRASRSSPYADMDRSLLKVISGQFVVVKE